MIKSSLVKLPPRKYHINNDFDSNCVNVIFLISFINYNKQYVGSAIDFKKRFRLHKGDINTTSKRTDVELLITS